MEHKVGEIFEHNGDTVQIVAKINCYDCIYKKNNLCKYPLIGNHGRPEPCSGSEREDRTSIIFKQVKDESVIGKLNTKIDYLNKRVYKLEKILRENGKI